jgi:hypothetical protein
VDASIRFEEHTTDLWNEELEQFLEILKNFLETLTKADREELIALLEALARPEVGLPSPSIGVGRQITGSFASDWNREPYL